MKKFNFDPDTKQILIVLLNMLTNPHFSYLKDICYRAIKGSEIELNAICTNFQEKKGYNRKQVIKGINTLIELCASNQINNFVEQLNNEKK